jgi:precorrin-3B synthase
MSAAVSRPGSVRGWCPGALRPMQTGDGLIVRLRLTGGVLSTALAASIAHWSRRWGNGQIDLSNRANLQLRGLSPHHLPALHDALVEAGLLDDSPAAEAVRNVIAGPLAGIDPAAILDIRPVVARLERRLASDASLHALPGKFGFAIDDGGRFGLECVPFDVWFEACAGPAFTVHLAGSADSFGPCAPDAAPDVAAAIAHAFLRYPGARRMRDATAATIARDAGLAPVGVCPVRAVHPCLGVYSLAGDEVDCRVANAPRNDRGGWPRCDGGGWPRGDGGGLPRGDGGEAPRNDRGGPPRDDRGGFVGVGVPFGRVAAEDLADLARAASVAGAEELRLTPWRAILIPVPTLTAAHTLSAQLTAFILDSDDPRRRIAACPGAPACSHATTHTREDATTLAARLLPGPGIALHVSGCDKGCAHPRDAPITLVGRNGRYDVVRNGTASAPPSLRGLTPAQAVDHLA